MGHRTHNTERFIAANDASPVVFGRVLDLQYGGARYKLSSGQAFELTRAECATLPTGYPRWAGVAS